MVDYIKWNVFGGVALSIDNMYTYKIQMYGVDTSKGTCTFLGGTNPGSCTPFTW